MRRVAAAASRYLTRVEELVSRTLLALLVLLVFVPAVTRTFDRPIIWSIEIAQLLFAWLAFLGANQAMRAGAHIGVDVLTRNLPPPIRKAVALFNLGLIAAFLATLLWYGIELTFVSAARRFMTTNLSFAFATVAAPLGAALLLLSTLGRVAAVIRGGPGGGAGCDDEDGEGRGEGHGAGVGVEGEAGAGVEGEAGVGVEGEAGVGVGVGHGGSPDGGGGRRSEAPAPHGGGGATGRESPGPRHRGGASGEDGPA